MSLWGKKDDVYSAGTITVNYSTKVVTGSGTTFSALSVGDVITIGTAGTFGQAIVAGITSDTLISIATTQYLSGAAISAQEWTANQQPKFLLGDSNYSILGVGNTINGIYGVDEAEVSVAKTTTYSVDHGGWVALKTYTDQHGNARVKHEVIVAMSGITTGTATTTGTGGDAADDSKFLP